MKKKWVFKREEACLDFFRKLFKVMRLTFFLLFVSLTQVIAVNSYSQVTRITLDMKSTTVRDVLYEIESKSEFYFFFNSKLVDVDRKVDIKVTNERIDQLLARLFEGQDVSYTVMDKHIIIQPSFVVSENEARQQSQITGRVTDVSGSPLPGVTVAVKGLAKGTITDSDGKYLLSGISSDAILVFSFVGMRTQEIQVAGKTSVNVVMEEETIGLNEVVAIGYGTVKKKDLTGAVATAGGEELAGRKTMKLSQALQGAVSGVAVTRSGSRPGSDGTIRIRGVTTIGDNTPLIIIDGVQGTMANVNPNDVESISILKDAAFSSIYGSKAAAGVILITTKRAKSGDFSLNYNMEYGYEKPTSVPKFVDAVGVFRYQNEEKWNDNSNTGSEYPVWAQNIVENYAALHAENPDKYPDTDWLDMMMNDNAPRQSHRLSITSGGDKLKTKILIADEKTDGVFDGISYENITLRANNDITVNKFISATVDLNYRYVINKNPSFLETTQTTPVGTFSTSAPFAALWSDGRVAVGQSSYNPYALLKYGGFNHQWDRIGNGKVALDIKPFEGLLISGIFSTNINNSKNKIFIKKIPYTNWEDPNIIAGYISSARVTSLEEGRSDGSNYVTQFLANYQKSIGQHSLNLLLGNENFYSFSESEGASSQYLLLTTYPYLDLANKNYLSVLGNASEYASRSFFGRLMYDYKNKYLLQVNGRYDGSSRFHQDYRWGFFPSLSAGWVVTEEPFMQNVNGLSFLKFRISYGSLGNERIGNYPYQATINFGNDVAIQGTSVVATQTAYISKYAIRDISWETTESLDAGLDASFFNNKLGLTFDYYHKVTKDMLLALEIPDYLGLSNPDQNTGKMNTKGWDFELRYNNTIGKLSYSVSANLSDYRSVMGDLGGTQFLGAQVKFEGSEFNEWYGYKTDGLFQTKEDLDNSVKLNTQIKVGDIKYLDLSGPDGVPDGKITPDYDRVLLGGSLPRYLYGGNISLDYKNFDLFLSFQGVGKQLARLNNNMVYQMNMDFPVETLGKYWSRYNSDEQNLKARYPRLSNTAYSSTYGTFSDFWLINGAYFRLKLISLGYNIPGPLAKKLMLKNAKVYASLTDLPSINNFPKGWDPETSTTSYFVTSSLIFGLSVNF